MIWAQKNLANLTAVYLPGVQNVQADFLLRISLDNEWTSLRSLQVGPVPGGHSESRLVRLLLQLQTREIIHKVSVSPGFWVYAMTDHWRFHRAYAFPPVPVILRFC